MTGTELGRIGRSAWIIPALAMLCLITYARSLTLPLISDDYLQIELGRNYGPFDRWDELARDPLYRCRATSILLTYWTEQLLGISSAILNLTSLVVHFLNTCLVLMLGIWRPVGFKIAVPMACLFACVQRPHEAVIWYSALPELLVFTFTMAAFLCWLKHLDSAQWEWYAGSLVLFALALLSKESAVVFVPLALIAAWGRRRMGLLLLPAVVSLLYFISIKSASSAHLHFNDGTFSLHAPFCSTELRSIGRLLWPWGGAAVGVCIWIRSGARSIGLALLWMAITLLPYSFLTYQNAVPSRHTYFASVGLAMILAVGWSTLRERLPNRTALTAALAFLCITYQIGYIWLHKHNAFVERAWATEELLGSIRGRPGPVTVRCFPYPPVVAELALRVGTGGSAWLAKDQGETEGAQIVDYCNSRKEIVQSLRR